MYISYAGSQSVNPLASGQNQGFLRKKHRNACGFVWEFLWSSQRYRPGQSLKRCGKSCSLHSKKNCLVERCGFLV